MNDAAPVSSRRRLQSYGRTEQAEPEVCEPRELGELVRILRRAAGERRRVTLRGAGHSFHDQALNDDLVIVLAGFDRILAIDPEAQTITVEPGVRWRAIVEAALAHGLFPYVVVSTGEATAGGTLSSDGISRHSPSYGSESAHILGFDLLTPGADEPRSIARPALEDDDDNARIFRAVIGGFGYLGVVTRITYRLLSVREVGGGEGPLQVATRVAAVRSFDELCEKQLRPGCAQALGCALERRAFPPAASSDDAPMLYSIAFMHEDNGRGAVYRSWYTRGLAYRPYLVFRPGSWLRILLGMLATFTPIGRIGWTIAWWYVLRDAREEIVFVNDALDYTFFMDANVEEKNLAERLGFGQPVIQQTFVVPPDRTAAFLDEIPELMARERIAPTLIDILYMHEDRTTMSASHGREGFACTLSFEDIRDESRRARVIDALYELSERCHAHGGRVHLTKNVFARPDTLARMYGEQLTRFLEVKRALDPDGILQNRFFERVFSASAALL